MSETPAASAETSTSAMKRAPRLQVALSVGAMALVGVSWKLWTPQAVFPQIPAIRGIVWADLAGWAILLALLCGLSLSAVQGIRGVPSRTGAVICIAAMVLLVLEDQHRLQAWAVHLLWLWVIFATARSDSIPRLALGLTVSVYLYSAISKFNPAFAEQHGRMLLDGLAGVGGIDIKRWPAPVLERLPYALPAGELLLAGGLAWKKTRTVAAWLSVSMHLLLIATFSPWGLNHARGVLIWNGLFVVQALLLWCIPERNHPGANQNIATTRLSPWECCLLAAILFVPAGRMGGVVDQWIGWSLYSPRTEVIRIHLTRDPATIDPAFPNFTSRPFQMIQADFVPVEVAPDRWSLAVLDVPLNPESRLELAVAIALCERFECWDSVRVERERRSLFSEKTEQQTFAGRKQILELADSYRMNVRTSRRYVAPP